MKITIYRNDGSPITVEGERAAIEAGPDRFELIEFTGSLGGLLIRLEEHADRLALDLAVFPVGGNSIRVKGGLR